VLVPSTWDVFNFAGAEAMACGAVVVASTGAGMAGLIVDGENGFRVNAEDSGALAEALRRLATVDGAGRARIGAAARETIRCELDPDRVAARNLDLYRQLHPAEAAHDALDTMLSPRADARASTEFLKQYPLRDLLGHAWSRLRQRWRA
jgi:glycogen synthase